MISKRAYDYKLKDMFWDIQIYFISCKLLRYRLPETAKFAWILLQQLSDAQNFGHFQFWDDMQSFAFTFYSIILCMKIYNFLLIGLSLNQLWIFKCFENNSCMMYDITIGLGNSINFSQSWEKSLIHSRVKIILEYWPYEQSV